MLSLPLKVNKSFFHYLKSYDLHYIIMIFYCSLVQLFPTYGLYPLQVGHEINAGDHEMIDGRGKKENEGLIHKFLLCFNVKYQII